MSTYDDGTDLEFFEEPETLEAPGRPRRRIRPSRGGGPRRPAPPPPGAVALARLAGLVALAIAIVVGLVFSVGSCGGPSRHDEYASYMNDMLPIAQSSAASLSDYQKEVTSPKLTLPDLQSKLGLWSRQQQQDYDEALRLVPPGQLQAAHQEALATLQLRAIALTDLANTVAAGGKSDTQVAAKLAKQAQLLTASDLVWAQLFKLPATDTLKKLGVSGVIAPSSQIVTNPEVITAHAFGEVYGGLHAASGNTSGGKVTGIHGSELLSTEAVSSGQTKTLSASTPVKVDVNAGLAFHVTFKNSGNSTEGKVPVTLTVSVFNNQVYKKTQKVLSIEAGQTKTVAFTNLGLPSSVFSQQATVSAVVGKVPGETNLANNHASYLVFFSLSG